MTQNELFNQKLFEEILAEIKQNSKRLEDIEADLIDIFITLESLSDDYTDPCILDFLN